MAFQTQKTIVNQYHEEFDAASVDDIALVLQRHTTSNYHWRGMHPFYEQFGSEDVASTFWIPLKQSFTSLQRRQDIFMSGSNDVDGGKTRWVCNMGHFTGLFDHDWLGIPATGKMTFLRYAEFHRIEQDKIAETALFCDIISVMHQAGLQPLPQQTGASFIHPGPRTHDGLQYDSHDEKEAVKTLDLVNRMVADLSELNLTGNDRCPPEVLAKTWHDDMVWYGPAGIGATCTIERYQKQHQYPFRHGLKNKVFNGHIARFAEGNYAGFFGWPNLTNTPVGGFLGLPGNDSRADMRVVDIYRREGDKLAENWVFIDLLHYLSLQGLDVLGRMKSMVITGVQYSD